MFTKGVRNTVKTILIFLLVIMMAVPQTSWISDGDTALQAKALIVQASASTKQVQPKVNGKTGWQISGKHTFFKNSKGKIVTGWQKIGGHYYYFQATGAANVKGRMVTGWSKINGKMYFLEQSGVVGVKGRMKTGWATIGKHNFFFNRSSGAVATGWQKIDNKWYYFEPKGAKGVIGRTTLGWKTLGGKTYYFKKTGAHGVKGQMLHGLIGTGKYTYYLGTANDGAVKTGWQTINKRKYYFRTSGGAGTKGRAYTGWNKINGKEYYFEQSSNVTARGRMFTGWRQIGNYKYYFNSSGQPLAGWQKIGKKWYYLQPSGSMGVKGRLQNGWKTINGKHYYLIHGSGKPGETGHMATGLVTLGSYKYYFGGNDDGAMRTGWQTISGAKYYFRTDGSVNGTRGQMLLGWHTIGNSEYFFYRDTGRMAVNATVDGVYLGKDGKAVRQSQAVVVGGSGQKTIKSFLRSALQPVGSTLYIWGGGHDAWQKGGDGVRAGVNPNWKKFYDKQSSSYDYDKYRFQYGNGLDCSGFVGWAAYNAIESKSNVIATGSATTSTSTGMPAKYASNGWGKNNSTSAGKFTPGDVVSRSGHVWIVLGQCSDGSVVIVHSTPQAGVQIAGTPTMGGNSNSEAIKLAQTYMKKFYPNVVSKFKLSSIVGTSNLKNINRFQWDVTGKKLMKDPEGYLKKTPAQILRDIYGS